MKKVTVTFAIPNRFHDTEPLIATIPLYFPYREEVCTDCFYSDKKKLDAANEMYEVIEPGESIKLDFFKKTQDNCFGWVVYRGKKLGLFGASPYERESIKNSIPPRVCDSRYYNAELHRSFYDDALLYSNREISGMITAKVASVTPLSKRRGRTKYSLMEIEFDIEPSAETAGDNWTIEEINEID